MALSSPSAYKAAATRSERDQAVTDNLTPEEFVIWQRTRLQFKGSPSARLTAFREWLHGESEDAAMAIVVDFAEAKLAAEIRKHEAAMAKEETEEETEEDGDVSFDFGFNTAHADEAPVPIAKPASKPVAKRASKPAKRSAEDERAITIARAVVASYVKRGDKADPDQLAAAIAILADLEGSTTERKAA